MSLVKVPTSPCWVLTHDKSAAFLDLGEGTPHYTTETDALRELWAYRSSVKDDYTAEEKAESEIWQALLVSKPEREPHPCYWLRCDGCQRYHVWDDSPAQQYGTHYEESQVDAQMLRDIEWTTDGAHRHHCPSCPAIPGHEDVMAHLAGPDDLPLPGMA